MLTIMYPAMVRDLRMLESGLWPRRTPDGSLILVIKGTKEAILAARIAKRLCLYFVPTVRSDCSVLGIITAFFDDPDEPLTITSPLFARDSLTSDLIELCSTENFDVHFFDEQNRELLGYSVSNKTAPHFREAAEAFRFASFSYEIARDFHNLMGQWFGQRTAIEDERAVLLEFGDALVPEDLFIIDATTKDHSGALKVTHTSLDREQPGAYQEADIAVLLRRVFAAQCIYLNPARTDDGREFVDILLVTATSIFLIQAKDSPNTEQALGRTIERKRSAAVSQVEKAARQMRGSIAYARSQRAINIKMGDLEHAILTNGRILRGIIIVKEMFSDDHGTYTAPAMEITAESSVPCIVIDYAQLHALTLHVDDEAAFDRGFAAIFETGCRTGAFPRLRFGLTDRDVL
jgi:hypothetical protein